MTLGPCLCGDPYCPSCGDPGREELENFLLSVTELLEEKIVHPLQCDLVLTILPVLLEKTKELAALDQLGDLQLERDHLLADLYELKERTKKE